MATRTTAQTAALEKKALAAGSKSEGMRMLLDAGYSVIEVRDVFGAPYGFVYGVARRNESINPVPRASAQVPPPAKARAEAKASLTKSGKVAPAKSVATKSKPASTRRVATKQPAAKAKASGKAKR